jgi:hypothetical protein
MLRQHHPTIATAAALICSKPPNTHNMSLAPLFLILPVQHQLIAVCKPESLTSLHRMTENTSSLPSTATTTDYEFLSEHFPTHNFPEFPDNFCSLKNENLFPVVEKLVFLKKLRPPVRASWMKDLEPVLLLISRIIFENPGFYGLFLKKNVPKED